MKKSTFLLLIFLMVNMVVFAQSVTNNQSVQINGSYVTITRFDVYPFNGSSNTKIDKSLHFKFDKNTKFFIDKVIDSESTIVGYVVTPWRFKEEREKTKFFDSVRKTRVEYYKRLAVAQINYSQAKEMFKKDSLSLDSAKTNMSIAKTALKKVTNTLITSPIATKSSPKKGNTSLSSNSADFLHAQNQLKSELNKSNTLADSSRAINDILSKVKAPTYQLSVETAELKNVQLRATKAQEKFYSARRKIENTLAALKASKMTFNGVLVDHKNTVTKGQQTNSDRNDTVFNLTKKQIYDRLDTTINDTSSLAAKYEDVAFVEAWANHWQFFVTAKDFTENCIVIYPHSNKFTWGFLTLPIKLRFDNDNAAGRFKFEQNLNFGLTFGDKMQLKSTNNVSLNYLLGISVVNVQLDNATGATSTAPAMAATSTPAVSMSLGMMLQYDQFQIGLFAGRDFAGEHANQFAYQGKPWIGFAIGLSLFGESKTSASPQKQ